MFAGGILVNNRAMDEIDLNGNFPPNKPRSLELPIRAFVTDWSVEVCFNTAIGTLNISIDDETGGAVYRQSVNTDTVQQLLIDIASFEKGRYTIEIVNSQTNLSGEFEI